MYYCPLDTLQGLIIIAINSLSTHAPGSVDVKSSEILKYYDYLNLRKFKTSIVNTSCLGGGGGGHCNPLPPPVTFLRISVQIHVQAC